MRWLINYIRSCFCKHEWEILWDVEHYNDYYTEIWHSRTYRCKKCGYSKTYKTRN